MCMGANTNARYKVEVLFSGKTNQPTPIGSCLGVHFEKCTPTVSNEKNTTLIGYI